MKRVFKFAITLSLITATFSAYAENVGTDGAGTGAFEAKVVLLKDNTTAVTWSEFVNAVNNPSSITGSADMTALNAAKKAVEDAEAAVPSDTYIENAQKQLDAAEREYGNWNGQLGTVGARLSEAQGDLTTAIASAPKVAAPWLQKLITNATSFDEAFSEYAILGETPTYKGTIFYQLTNSDKVLNLAFDSSCKIDGMDEGDVAKFGAAIKDKGIRLVYIYFGNNLTDDEGAIISNGKQKVGSYQSNSNWEDVISCALSELKTLQSTGKYTQPAQTQAVIDAQKTVNNIKDELATLNANIADYTQTLYTANTDENGNTTFTKVAEGQQGETKQNLLKDVIANAEKAKDALKTAKENLAIAQSEYDKAVADAQATAATNYSSVTLTGDVTASAYIDNYDATININGNNHVITLNNITELFHTPPSKGVLTKVAVNGSLGQTAGVTITSVAYSKGAEFGYYDESGAQTKYTTIGALGFAAREYYGIDFATNTIAPRSDQTKVYSIKVHSASNTSTATEYFVQKNGTTLTYKDGQLEIPANTFIYSATNDLTGIANVFYNDNTCDEVVITDKNPFYCPVDITAKTVKFDRTLKQGYNTVCVPFDLNTSDYGADDYLCTYDQETPTKFWFNKTTGTIAANTPVLLYLGSGSNTSLNRSNVTIKATPADQLSISNGTDNTSKAYGLLKNATADQITGAANAYKVYGLQGTGEGGAPKFNPSASKTFPAFRMVIASEIASQQVQNEGPLRARSIGIRDEDGKEISVGTASMEVIDMEASTVNVAGGQGEIIITTDANYGPQSVYSLDGKTVTTVDVIEGTTTVNVQSGIYIVMGEKVLVK